MMREGSSGREGMDADGVPNDSTHCDNDSDNNEHDDDDDDGDSDDDGDDGDDDDSEDDDGEEEEEGKSKKSRSSLFSEMKEMWHQHLIAVLIAVLASFCIHRQINNAMDPTSHNNSTRAYVAKHSFLVNYQRTSSVSFCGIASLTPTTAESTARPQNELQIFEFGLSKDHVPSIARHFAADVLQDDRYEHVFGSNHVGAAINDQLDALSEVIGDHNEYQCLQTQVASTSLRLKGHAYYYPSPSVHSMYDDDIHSKAALAVTRSNKQQTKLKPVYLTFTGFAIKVVNMSVKPVLLYWEGRSRRLVGEIGPFESIGTASQSSGQTFVVTSIDDSDSPLQQWIVTVDSPILYFDPRDERGQRTVQEEQRYQMLQLSKQYEMEYSVVAKRPWLAQFPRPLPVHPFWPAQYFDQTHTFRSSSGKVYTIKVASVTPRVFTVAHFLSNDECDQLIQLAREEGLKPSTLQSGGGTTTRARQHRDQSTRSSSNTWLPRESTDLTDRVYRRAAQLLQIDESLLLQTRMGEEMLLHAHEHALAESLQVVRYQQSEEYTAHHDFVYPPTFHRHQPTRFATILLYLNDDFEGGETVFPRAANAKNHDGIVITPQKGTAVLFYNMLPDGNMDDLSQHASRPVEVGEKWLANLWVWEPHIY